MNDYDRIDIVDVLIGNRPFVVRKPLAEALIKVLEEGKRFWEWEEEIIMLKKLVDALKEAKHG